MRLRALAFALVCLAPLAHAEVTLQGEPEVGIFVTQQRDAQPGERVLTRATDAIEPTTRIPARLGTRFGVRFSLAGKATAEAPLSMFYFTPGVVTPDGTRHDKFEVHQKIEPATASEVMAFEFTDQWEVVPGEWRFEVYQGDRRLLSQAFQVQ
ncbi:protein of unknown function [Halopseudomonas sabulinigri]|uniref:DUF3859 domain-containing protein n=1 Tax=Halopseudomonas sabulinigri TaxID=472181 RepID=A0A1H1UNY1_9GAMM|nr:DUF3859 domain-containing protein [Halopseudomonas sabulinigri]SDS74248.1 protein of unknown function [Halopseudomonas sabulinigri]